MYGRVALLTTLAVAVFCGALMAARSVLAPTPTVFARAVETGPAFQCDDRTFAVCTIRRANGGNILKHIRAANALVSQHVRLIVDGSCASSCVLVAGALNANGLACVTDRAVFYLHRGRTETDYVDAPLLGGLQRWVDDRGGYPIDPRAWITVAADEAVRVIPKCVRDGMEGH